MPLPPSASDPHPNPHTGVAQVRELAASDDDAWDQLVVGSPQGNVFLLSSWLRMLTETSSDNLRFLRVGAFDAHDQLRGGWAIPWQEWYGLCLSHGFDFFYCGPMLVPELSTATVHQIGERQRVLTALARTVANRTDMVVAEAHPSLRDLRAFLFEEWQVSPEYTHVWDLTDPESLLRAMNREKRREIRRALECFQFEAEATGGSNLDVFMTLYRAAMGKFSWYPTPRWEAVLRQRIGWMQQQDRCRFYTARTNGGDVLAALVVLISHEDGTAYYWRMGYDTRGRDATVAPALYWQAALKLRQESPALRFINFGGSPQPALSQFKDFLGATPTEHFRLIRRRSSTGVKLFRLSQAVRNRARQWLGASSVLKRVYQSLSRRNRSSLPV
jgi:hypothetical protein